MIAILSQIIKIALFFLLLIPKIHAGFSFCFERRNSLEDIKSYMQKIASPKDQIYLREKDHCLDIESSEIKEPLFRQWAQKRYRLVTSSTTVQPSSKMCRLKLTQEGSALEDKTQVSLTRKQALLRKAELSKRSSRVRTLLVQSGKEASLRVDDSKLQIKCYWRNATTYETVFSLESLKNSISSSLTLRKGQRIELGDVVDDLNQKDNSASLSGIKHQKNTRDSKISYWLEIN